MMEHRDFFKQGVQIQEPTPIVKWVDGFEYEKPNKWELIKDRIWSVTIWFGVAVIVLSILLACYIFFGEEGLTFCLIGMVFGLISSSR